MKAFRLNRIFEQGSGLFIGVAFEEDFLSSHDVLSGLQAMRTANARGADVVEASVSQALAWRSVAATGGVFLKAGRVDASTFPRTCGCLVEQALRLDAVGIVAHLGREGLVTESRNIAFLKEKCDRYDLPLMVDVSKSEGNPSQVSLAIKAVQAGADLVKANLTKDGLKVLDAIPGIPLIAAVDSAAALRDVQDLAKVGVRGLIFRRDLLISSVVRTQTLGKLSSRQRAPDTKLKLKGAR